MVELENLVALLRAGDVYAVLACFVYWAWRSDRRFVAIETTLQLMLRHKAGV